MIDLNGQTAVVTGGSRGIGRATCRLLARAGAHVAFGYHKNHEAAREVLDEIRALGRQALAIPGDVSDPEVAAELIERTGSVLGPIGIGVANAGIWLRAPIDEMSAQQWNETIGINLTSIYHFCRHIVPGMKKRQAGRLVLITSTAGQRGEAFHSHYAASKGGVIALTKSLAAELGPWGINVNAVAPGWVETDMVTEVAADPVRWHDICSTIPLGRVAQPEDVAGAVLFLASDLARHVQGEIVNVNGGSVMCG